jgi:hypothetical protein
MGAEYDKTPITITWESQQNTAEDVLDSMCIQDRITLTPDIRTKVIDIFVNDMMETITTLLNNFDDHFDFDNQMAEAICEITGVDHIEQLTKEDN